MIEALTEILIEILTEVLIEVHIKVLIEVQIKVLIRFNYLLNLIIYLRLLRNNKMDNLIEFDEGKINIK